jgi:hypothetical protein
MVDSIKRSEDLNPTTLFGIGDTFDKAPMFSGAIRFTASGEEASYNSDLSVITYKKGHRGRVGTRIHDTARSVERHLARLT